MILVLGTISLIQILFLPGYLFARFLMKPEGALRAIILCTSLSLLINHLIVYILTALHIYSRISLAVVLTLEMAMLIMPIGRFSGRPFKFSCSSDLAQFKVVWHDMSTGSLLLLFLRRAAFFTALVTLIFFVFRFMNGFGTIFDQWDDVVSWNRWAVDWYNGRFPTFTWHYPQLLPSVWSITYQLIGTSDLQFFAKGLMGIFPLLLLIALFDLWLRNGAVGYLAGIPITAFLLFFANGVKGVGSGYADVPVALMAFVPVYLLLTTKNEEGCRKGVLLAGSLITAGAALTKQAGLMVLILYPLLCWYHASSHGKQVNLPISRIIINFFVAVALVLPWYISTEYNIRKGVEKSEIKLVTEDIQQSRNLLSRVRNIHQEVVYLVKNSPKLEQITSILGVSIIDSVKVTYIIMFSIVFLSLLSIRDPLWRLPVLTVMLPYTAIWLIYFSYDFRNLSLALPYMGAGAGLGLMHYGELIAKRLPSGRLSVAGTMIILIILVGSLTDIDKSYLTARQLRLQREIGNPEVNRFIYALISKNEVAIFLTNYQPIRYLPGLEKNICLRVLKTQSRLQD